MNEENENLEPVTEESTPMEPVKEFDVEVISAYLSDGYLDSLNSNQVIDLVNMPLKELDVLLGELTDDLPEDAKVDVIRQSLIGKIGAQLTYSIFAAYDNLSGDSHHFKRLEKGNWKNSLTEMFADHPQKSRVQARPRKVLPAKSTYQAMLSDSKHSTYIEFPLPATGIRIKVEPLPPSTFALLQVRIAREKVAVNRRTYGTKFDLNTAVADGLIIETLLGCVIGCNLEGWTTEMLIDIFDDRDLDELCLRMLIPHFPKGYNLRMTCMAPVEEEPVVIPGEEGELDTEIEPDKSKPKICGHVNQRTLNLSHVLWYDYLDEDRLRDHHAFSVIKRDKDITFEEWQDFKNSEPLVDNIIGRNGWEIELMPATTMSRSLENTRWINEIEKELIKTFNNNVSENMLTERIISVMMMEELRNFIPFIKAYRTYEQGDLNDEPVLTSEILIKGNSNTDNAKKIMRSLSSSDDVGFIADGIHKFLANNLFNLPVYTNITCAKCGKVHKPEREVDALMPLQVKRLFFTIMEQKLDRTVNK